jgi:hypothetical protein
MSKCRLLERIKIHLIRIKSEEDPVKEIARIANLSMKSGYRLEAKNEQRRGLCAAWNRCFAVKSCLGLRSIEGIRAGRKTKPGAESLRALPVKHPVSYD